jgi:hypothetical protein
MSDESAEFGTGELLSAIGKVRLPEPRALEDAREVLWSAIAREMLDTGSAGEQVTMTGESTGREEDHRGTARRRQTERSKDKRRMSMGEGDPEN